MNILIKRIYEKPESSDGARILVDRLWPRGLSKEKAKLDDWIKEIAPSNELRHWYGHDPAKWEEFKERYYNELKPKASEVDKLLGYVKAGTVTLLFSSKELKLNNAVALREYLQTHEMKQ